MLVSHRRKFIYTKTIKTASTSVEVFFEPSCRSTDDSTSALLQAIVGDAGIIGYRGPHCRGKKWYNHMPAKKIKANLGEEVWKKYFKFCVIRNPFEKLVSAYHFYEWLIDSSSGWQKKKLILQHGLFPSKSRDDIQRFRKWVAWTWWFNDRALYMIDGELCIDFFIRYENLMDDVKTVCERLEIPYCPGDMPKFNSQMNPRARTLDEYYDDRTIRTVRKRFQFELDYFDYDI